MGEITRSEVADMIEVQLGNYERVIAAPRYIQTTQTLAEITGKLRTIIGEGPGDTGILGKMMGKLDNLLRKDTEADGAAKQRGFIYKVLAWVTASFFAYAGAEKIVTSIKSFLVRIL